MDSDKLRFDFSHFESILPEQLKQIEDTVNAQIRRNHPLTTELMELEEAKASGAIALFGEKYDEKVRVVQMGDFSTELAEALRPKNSDIGLFKIISEGGIAAASEEPTVTAQDARFVENQKA